MTAYRIGKAGMAIAATAAIAMCLLSFILNPERPLPGQPGICLPPPSEWQMPPFISWLLNTVLIGTVTVAVIFLNRKFNFVRTTRPVLPAVFIVMASSCPWITSTLCSSVLICGVYVLSYWILFSEYDSGNATQSMFVTATFISIGSMFQYAFLANAIVCLLSGVILKCMKFKEFIAFVLGLIAPYWVALGFGWVQIDSFRVPQLSPLFSSATDPADLFLLMSSIGIAVFAGIAAGAADSMKIYAGNSKVNAMNSVIYLTGAVSTICILIDFNNIFAYITTLYLCVAVQLANLSALHNFKHEWLVSFIPAIVYTGFFIALTF